MNSTETTARRGDRPSKSRRLVACLLALGTSFLLNGCGRMGGGQLIQRLGGGNGQLLARAANGVGLAGNIVAQFDQTGTATGVLNAVQGGLTQGAQMRGMR